MFYLNFDETIIRSVYLLADNIYAELGDDLGKRFPSKKGCDINKTWDIGRQHLPLPPTPGDPGKAAPDGSAAKKSGDPNSLLSPPARPFLAPGGTPPPRYKDLLKDGHGGPSINQHKPDNTQTAAACANVEEDLYLTPLTDVEAELAKEREKSRQSVLFEDAQGHNNMAYHPPADDTYLNPRVSLIPEDTESLEGAGAAIAPIPEDIPGEVAPAPPRFAPKASLVTQTLSAPTQPSKPFYENVEYAIGGSFDDNTW